jgi:hypothetical protein
MTMKTTIAVGLALALLIAGTMGYCQQFDPRGIQSQQEYQPQPQVDGTDLPPLPKSGPVLELPTLELPPELELPITMVGCWRGESVLEDMELVHGKYEPDIYTTAVYTLCYRRNTNGKYQLNVTAVSADPGTTYGVTSFTGLLLHSGAAKVKIQVSDIQAQVVPVDQPDSFRLDGSCKRSDLLWLLGLKAYEDFREGRILRCHVNSPSSVHCAIEETSERTDGSWEALAHSHMDMVRVGNERASQ